MTHDAREKSLESGQPIELYQIIVGSTIYRWTSAQDAVTYLSNTYEPENIVREAYTQGPDDRDNVLSITVDATNPFVLPYRVMPMDTKPTITLIRLHRGEAAGVTAWKGRVQTVTFRDEMTKAVLDCLPDVGASSRPIPRHTYGVQCQAALFGSECQVSEALFTFNGTVSVLSADSKTLTVPGLFASKGAGWASAGHVVLGDEKRMIIAQAGDDVTLNAPFAASPLGQSVEVKAGCRHDSTDCAVKFNNLINFRGFPYSPLKNPWETGLDDV